MKRDEMRRELGVAEDLTKGPADPEVFLDDHGQYAEPSGGFFDNQALFIGRKLSERGHAAGSSIAMARR